MIVEKLKQMGIEINDPPTPLASYVPAIQNDHYVYTSGQIPLVGGMLKYKGKLGLDLSEEQGYEAAKICAINCLCAIKGVIADLDRIEQVIRVKGFVNSAPGFIMQSKVINGASDFLGELFGEYGKHVRSAVGVNELPMDAAVEIELIVRLKK